MPKDKRKSTFKQRKEKLEAEHEEREKAFLVKLNENHESSLRRLSDSHRERIALRERQYLQQKQQVCNVDIEFSFILWVTCLILFSMP